MAEKNEKTDDATSDADSKKPAGNTKRLILLIVLGVAIIGLSVGGTLLAIKYLSPPSETATLDAEPVEEKEPLPKPAIYYPIKPPFIVNFQVKGRQRFLQAELTLMTRDDSVIRDLEMHMPMLRNALVLLIGGQVYSEIQTAEGKELLRQQCLQEIQRLMQAEIGKPGIEQVLFTNFVMQ